MRRLVRPMCVVGRPCTSPGAPRRGSTVMFGEPPCRSRRLGHHRSSLNDSSQSVTRQNSLMGADAGLDELRRRAAEATHRGGSA